jgi:amino acid permease
MDLQHIYKRIAPLSQTQTRSTSRNTSTNSGSNNLGLRSSGSEVNMMPDEISSLSSSISTTDYVGGTHASPERSKLKRNTLTVKDGWAIIVGIIIGSGIFSSPGVALARSGSLGAMFLAWITAGCLVCVSATCYFELGAMMPSAGGDFEYLRVAYGDRYV